jgi:hypothetical protein
MKLSKDSEGNDIQPDWHQSEVIHCPDHECDGMLLQSIYYYPMKCSNCNKFLINVVRWVEYNED